MFIIFSFVLTAKGTETYEQLCEEAMDIVLKSLSFARKKEAAPWRYLASFAAAGHLHENHISLFKDVLFVLSYLRPPSRRRSDVLTNEEYDAAACKARFCWYVYGENSLLTVKWSKYADRMESPQLSHPLIEL